MSNLPSAPIYLWFENELVVPDRERTQDQRVHSVDNPQLIPFSPTPDVANSAAVLIFPGGGYTRLAINHEGHDIARWFAERGVAAFVVKYRLVEYGFPAPMLDGLRAIRLVRKNAEAWGIDPSKIGVVGFSAGGHVAASVAVHSERAFGEAPLEGVSARPDFVVLGYPVITLVGSDAHLGCRNALLGETPDSQLLYENSLQFHVKDDAPPMFIFHGVGDQAVPVGNSLEFFTQLYKCNQQSELHLYQTHIHGVGMIQGQGSVSNWPNALELWLYQNCILKSKVVV